MSEINRIAEKFLREHMSNNVSVEFHKVVCPSRRYEVQDSHETATEFLEQIQARGPVVESERIDVSETAAVNVLRVVRKGHPIQPAFLSGFRKRDGKPIWVFEARLACALQADKAAAFLQVLKEYGFECFVLPAPEVRHGSL